MGPPSLENVVSDQIVPAQTPDKSYYKPHDAPCSYYLHLNPCSPGQSLHYRQCGERAYLCSHHYTSEASFDTEHGYIYRLNEHARDHMYDRVTGLDGGPPKPCIVHGKKKKLPLLPGKYLAPELLRYRVGPDGAARYQSQYDSPACAFLTQAWPKFGGESSQAGQVYYKSLVPLEKPKTYGLYYVSDVGGFIYEVLHASESMFHSEIAEFFKKYYHQDLVKANSANNMSKDYGRKIGLWSTETSFQPKVTKPIKETDVNVLEENLKFVGW